MAAANIIVWGEAGVGKSTLINDLLGHRAAAVGDGSSAAGVTKALTGYLGNVNGIPVKLWDMPGHGDHDISPWEVLTVLALTFRDLKVDGILILTKDKLRVNTGPRMVAKLLDMSFTASDKWSAMALIGTMAESWTQREKTNFGSTVLASFNAKVQGNVTRVAVTSTQSRQDVIDVISQLARGSGVGSMTLPDVRAVARMTLEEQGVSPDEIDAEMDQQVREMNKQYADLVAKFEDMKRQPAPTTSFHGFQLGPIKIGVWK